MKYGIYAPYWTHEWATENEYYIPKVKKLGFDVLEISCVNLIHDYTTKEQLREESRPNALHSVQMQAAIETIVDLEGLTAEDKDIAEAYELICRQNRMTMDQMKEYIDAEFEQAVARSVLSSKAMQLIRETAEITYKTDEA